MTNFEIIRCRHNSKAECEKCRRHEKCTVRPVVCDVNVIASAFLEEDNTQRALEFLKLNRRKYRVIITNDILGEIVAAIIKESREPELIDNNLAKLKCHVINFTITDSLYQEKEFREILEKLLDCHELRCGSTDRINIATAAYLDCPLFTFDENIYGDKNSIMVVLSELGYKFKLL